MTTQLHYPVGYGNFFKKRLVKIIIFAHRLELLQISVYVFNYTQELGIIKMLYLATLRLPVKTHDRPRLPRGPAYNSLTVFENSF